MVCFLYVYFVCFVFTLFSSKVEGGRENKKPFGSVQGHGCVSDRGELHIRAFEEPYGTPGNSN